MGHKSICEYQVHKCNMCLPCMNLCILMNLALLYELYYHLLFDLKATFEHPSTPRFQDIQQCTEHATCKKER